MPFKKGQKAWNKGICHLSPEARKRISEASRNRIIENGHPKGMLGKKHSKKTIKKIKKWIPTEKQKQKQKENTLRANKHPNWSGHTPSYSTLHKRINSQWGKANKCENCHTTDKCRFEWSNKDGKYKMRKKDWWQLCVRCHRFFDKNPIALK